MSVILPQVIPNPREEVDRVSDSYGKDHKGQPFPSDASDDDVVNWDKTSRWGYNQEAPIIAATSAFNSISTCKLHTPATSQHCSFAVFCPVNSNKSG